MVKAKNLLRLFLGFPSTIIAFIFIGKIIIDNKNILIPLFFKIDPILLFIGILSFSVFFWIKGMIWLALLAKRGHLVPKRSYLYQYSLSEFKRYIPGNIFSILAKIDTHTDIPKKETLKNIGFESILLVTSAFTLSLPILTKIIDVNYLILLTVITVCIFAVFCFYKRSIINTVVKYIDLYFLAIVGWIFFALGCYFASISLAFINPLYINFILSAFIFSWLIGYLFFIAPMGLGVREIASIYLLSQFTPIGIATTFSLLSRVGMIFGEIIYILFVKLLYSIKNNSKSLKADRYFLILIFASFIYFVLFSSLSILKHDAYLSGRFDLGNMSQTVWNTSQGRIFELTNPDGTNTMSRLGIHSDFILIFFAPLYLILSDPKLLLIFQTLFIAIGGIYTYLLSDTLIQNRKLSLAIAVSYLLNFWIHQQNMFDFHAVSMATSLIIASFYYYAIKKYKWFSFLLFLALVTKENVFLIVSLFGIFIAVKKNKILGIAISAICLLSFFVLTKFTIPYFRGSEHFAASYFSYLGDTPSKMIINAFLKPELIFKQVISTQTFEYLIKIFLPTGFISLIAPLSLIFSLPEIVIYLLSSNQNLKSHYYHYGALIVPFVYLSAIFGLKKIINFTKYKNIKSLLFYYILSVSIFSAFMYSPLPGMKNADYRFYDNKNSILVRNYLKLIPDDAKVSASNNIGAHLSNRNYIYVAPRGIDIADYVVLYGESETLKNNIDSLKYDLILSDLDINFMIYKKNNLPTKSSP